MYLYSIERSVWSVNSVMGFVQNIQIQNKHEPSVGVYRNCKVSSCVALVCQIMSDPSKLHPAKVKPTSFRYLNSCVILVHPSTSRGRRFHCHCPGALKDQCVLRLKVADIDSMISTCMILHGYLCSLPPYPPFFSPLTMTDLG